jgi:hypothetical protein
MEVAVADFTAAAVAAGASMAAGASKGAADRVPAAVVDSAAAPTPRAPGTQVLALLRRTLDARTVDLRAVQVTNSRVPATASPAETSAQATPHRHPRRMVAGTRLVGRRAAGKPPGAAGPRPAVGTFTCSAATGRLVDQAARFAAFRARAARSGRIRPRRTMSFLDLNRFRPFTIHSVERLQQVPLRVPVRRYPRRAASVLHHPWALEAFRAG